jgi:metal-sulfur cluster biosynthetic enzyme
MPIDQTAVIEKLKECYDPEIKVNIYDLGLIYELKVNEADVYVKTSLTSPGCPVGDYIMAQIDERIREVPGVKDVKVDLTFEPPWDLTKVTEDGKEQLMFLGIKV